jgi:PAS domain S-box-containing protein
MEAEQFEEQHLRVLNAKLVQTTSELQWKTSHLTALIEMNLRLASERDPRVLLQSFCRSARDLVAAKQAIVVVRGAEAADVLHVFMNGIAQEATVALDSALRQDSVFAEFMADSHALRRRSDGDPRAAGLPAEHPAVHSLVVAPIRSLKQVYGWVCATEKIGLEEFDDEDERLLAMLAAQVGRIYENGSLYAELECQAVALRAENAERRQAEAALRRSMTSFEYLFSNNPLPMWICHLGSLQFLEVNEAAIATYGYGRTEFLATSLFDIVAPEDLDRLVENNIHAASTSSDRSRNWRHRRKDGRAIEVDIFSRTFEFNGERARLMLGIDVTRQNEAERQLLQAQKMEAIGQLTGGVAHDFNNLLGIVLGNLEMIREETGGESAQRELADAAIEAALHGAELTRQLLAVARRQPLAPKHAVLAPLLESMARLLRRSLGDSITLDLVLAESTWPVLIDLSQLESTILNLAVNARDAMPDGGRLTIETANAIIDAADVDLQPDAEPGEYVVIAVSDTGKGMSPDVLGHALEPFFTTKGADGSGLGLSMVHGFVKQSGGHTQIYSEPGRGTTIKIYLPHVEAMAPGEIRPIAMAPAPRGEEVILVVDDNKGMRDIAVRQLQSLGYRTIPASDPAHALEIVQGGAPINLLFTDMVMPGGMDGRALAEAARHLRPGLKVLLTSGFTQAAASAVSENRLSFALLSKPYRKEELARTVRAAIDGGDSA